MNVFEASSILKLHSGEREITKPEQIRILKTNSHQSRSVSHATYHSHDENSYRGWWRLRSYPSPSHHANSEPRNHSVKRSKQGRKCEYIRSLTRRSQSKPELEERYDCQVAVVDYDDAESLRFALKGIDLVISTIRGQEQINVIHAARHARVRLFVPAEFEGSISHRPTSGQDPLDYGSSEAIELLKHCASSKSRKMEYTVFSCGVLYERFAPGGLAEYGMGARATIGSQGVYLVDVGNASADIVETNGSGRPVQVCMTSVGDVARFVAAAIELGPGTWPHEFKMRGDRMSVRDIFAKCSNVRGGE